jgi:hypothetical protein
LEAYSGQGSGCDILLACYDLCLYPHIVRLTEPRTSSARETLTICRSIVLLWTSVIIPQHRELAVLGTQVCYLVHSNCPQRFSPPVLVYLIRSRRKAHSRSKPILRNIEDDERGLTNSPSRGTRLASTAQSGGEKVVLPEAAHAQDRFVSLLAAHAHAISANHRPGVLRPLC